MIHGLGEHGDMRIGRIRQSQNGRPDNQHRHAGCAHDDDEAAKRLAAFLLVGAVIGRNEIGEDLDSRS